MDNKRNKAGLIRDFFGLSGSDAIREVKALNEKDRVELGTAIAKSKGLTEADVDFPFVKY